MNDYARGALEALAWFESWLERVERKAEGNGVGQCVWSLGREPKKMFDSLPKRLDAIRIADHRLILLTINGGPACLLRAINIRALSGCMLAPGVVTLLWELNLSRYDMLN